MSRLVDGLQQTAVGQYLWQLVVNSAGAAGTVEVAAQQRLRG